MIYRLLNNPATTFAFMCAIGFFGLCYGIRCLFDQIKDTNAGGSNVGDEG